MVVVLRGKFEERGVFLALIMTYSALVNMNRKEKASENRISERFSSALVGFPYFKANESMDIKNITYITFNLIDMCILLFIFFTHC
jgi:hypothetical protein